MYLLSERSVSFLGHYIDKDGVRTDPEKIRKIAEYPLPTSAAELRTFLGMASYYRKFIAGFAKLTKNLYRAAQGDMVKTMDADIRARFKRKRSRMWCRTPQKR
ncbi:hypothetical protein OSTOST_03453 [Ostertagia ostertagi]